VDADKFYEAQFIGLRANLHFLANNASGELLERMRREMVETGKFLQRRIENEKISVAEISRNGVNSEFVRVS